MATDPHEKSHYTWKPSLGGIMLMRDGYTINWIRFNKEKKVYCNKNGDELDADLDKAKQMEMEAQINADKSKLGQTD